jgi:hypothetical protein
MDRQKGKNKQTKGSQILTAVQSQVIGVSEGKWFNEKEMRGERGAMHIASS